MASVRSFPRGLLWRRPRWYSVMRYVGLLPRWVRELYCPTTYLCIMYAYVWVYVCMYVCWHVCMYVCVCVYVCVYMYVCTYAWMYVCMRVCMYSWIKIDQLDVTCFIISLFTAQYVSNVSTFIFRSLRLTVDLFHVLYCSVRIEVLALASLFSSEWLVVTCVVVLISVFL
jgi:nuclear pore complex protein Nup62